MVDVFVKRQLELHIEHRIRSVVFLTKYSGKGEKTDLSKEASNQKQFSLFSVTL